MSRSDQSIAIVEQMLSDPVWSQTTLLEVLSGRARDAVRDCKVTIQYPKSVDQVDVFVLLYHQQGCSVTVWENVLRQIRQAVKCRPVYMDRGVAVKNIAQHTNESIVCLKVDRSEVISVSGAYYIKPNAVSAKNIQGFYWSNRVYAYDQGALEEV